MGLLPEIANPENRDGVIGCALNQADPGIGGAPIAHSNADQDQLNAGKDSESQSDPEHLLTPAIPEQAAKNHQETEESALHDADAAIEGEHHGHDSIGTA